MAETLLVAGTASHVGKSTVAAGLCRLLADRGADVAPFKAQNMSNNARAVANATGEGWGEVGVSQYVQARAARIPATTDHNPVLLKPRGSGESQVVLHGEAVGHYAAGEYYDDHWDDALAAARESHARLAADHDVVVAEGAGSIAEINLRHRDLANLETARFADADVLLVADIERGGVFASLVGTLELLPGDVRERVVGCVITKFRGDRSLLAPGLEEFEERTGVPVLGVLPHDDPGLPEEDSLALPDEGERAVRGADDGVPDEQSVTVGVLRLPRISNATDVEPLVREPGVRVRYVPIEDSLDGLDALVLPGTKNTVDDLLAVRDAGTDERIRAFDGPIVGLCGGYQLLGERIENAAVEGTGEREAVEGIGRLPVETRFREDKAVRAVTREIAGAGPLAGFEGEMSGYEIHMGRTERRGGTPVGETGVASGAVLGTYLHGLFENPGARDAYVRNTYEAAGRERPAAARERGYPADSAADLLREHVDLSVLRR
ncbi:cobyric acid synthase [Halomicrobium urmianum]|uniref:cobyric acid synthase n=1 Tax=Halomicrobium urmianum TaxID=1586233 RepID=UPI001CD92B73|nr:cobyric acid synthase [Halomicrobium urmianum]